MFHASLSPTAVPLAIAVWSTCGISILVPDFWENITGYQLLILQSGWVSIVIVIRRGVTAVLLLMQSVEAAGDALAIHAFIGGLKH